jgi:flagellin
MIINHNISAMFAERTLQNIGSEIGKNTARLASGQKNVGDFPANLAMTSGRIRGLQMASFNAQNDISLIQTTEGYLQETQDILHRLRELAVASANGIYTAEDRSQIQVEVSQLVDEIDRIASHAQFNGMNLLTGRFANPGDGNSAASLWFHIGANMDHRERVFIGTMTAKALNMRGGDDTINIHLDEQENANRSIGALDDALKKVSKQRADLGAYQNRLEHTVRGNDLDAENLTASDSRIADTNMASETAAYAKNQVLRSAASSMLSQANSRGEQDLQLLE